MDATRFDRLLRRLATRHLSRRTTLRAAGAGLAATALSPLAGGAAQGTPAADGRMAENNATLFVQTATSGTFAPNPRAGIANRLCHG